MANVFAPNNENHFLDLIPRGEKFVGCFKRNSRRLFNWITVRATADCGKRDRFDSGLQPNPQCITVAICQRLRLALFSATPDRSDCVNNESSRQTIPARDFSFAWATTIERSTFRDQLGPRRAMNRAIHSASAKKRRVGGIHNGINVQLGDVAAEDFDSAIGVLHQSFFN
jgi:hypothetical protein